MIGVMILMCAASLAHDECNAATALDVVRPPLTFLDARECARAVALSLPGLIPVFDHTGAGAASGGVYPVIHCEATRQ